MFYHTVVLHLFRPFLRVDLMNSKVSPRDICTSCANSIASVVSIYRQTYGLRRSPLLIPHVILSSCIIHLLNLPDPSSAQNLAAGFRSLSEISINHAFALQAVDIIIALAKQWSIDLPLDVAQASYHTPPEVPANTSSDMGTRQPAPPCLSPISSPQQHDANSRKDFTNDAPFLALRNSPRPFSTPADIFWSPFTDHSVPLQANHQADPMDISALLAVQNNDWDQMNRDGFKVASLDDSLTRTLCYNNSSGQWTQT